MEGPATAGVCGCARPSLCGRSLCTRPAQPMYRRRWVPKPNGTTGTHCLRWRVGGCAGDNQPTACRCGCAVRCMTALHGARHAQRASVEAEVGRLLLLAIQRARVDLLLQRLNLHHITLQHAATRSTAMQSSSTCWNVVQHDATTRKTRHACLPQTRSAPIRFHSNAYPPKACPPHQGDRHRDLKVARCGQIRALILLITGPS